MILLVAIIVLICWGLGALVGSATSYLTGALIGVVATIVVLTVAGILAARRLPQDRPNGPPLQRWD